MAETTCRVRNVRITATSVIYVVHTLRMNCWQEIPWSLFCEIEST